jgi:type I restriction enzyme S subunit
MGKSERYDMIDVSRPPLEVFTVGSAQIQNASEKRIDASFYSKEIVAAESLINRLQKNGVEISTVQKQSQDVYYPTRFKRSYTAKGVGVPFLTPSDIFTLPLQIRKYVVAPPDGLTTPPKSILVTRSGTVGRSTINNSFTAKCILSDDIIRVKLDNPDILGYLYVFFNTRIGKAFLTQNKYGATVKHIEPHHVKKIPLPLFHDLIHGLNEKINEVYNLREAAQSLLFDAEDLLISELGLPQIGEENIEYFGGHKGSVVRSFEVGVSELENRLDASYHIPLARLATTIMTETESATVKRLEELAFSFVPPRFVRPYVSVPSEGIPLLQGSHMARIKPLDLRYIWSKMKKLESYAVKKDWILVTCSGTIGRLSMVRNQWAGWTATNHLLRIVPNEGKTHPQNRIHPGYLAAFLLSVYGQIQLQRLIYGGVIDEVGEAGELFNDILILKPLDEQVEVRIGDLVVDAFDKRDEANEIEAAAMKLFEGELERRGTE